MKLTITIPRNILDDEDKLCDFYAQLESEYGRKIVNIKAIRLNHEIYFKDEE